MCCRGKGMGEHTVLYLQYLHGTCSTFQYSVTVQKGSFINNALNVSDKQVVYEVATLSCTKYVNVIIVPNCSC